MTQTTTEYQQEFKRRYTLRNTMLRAFQQNKELTTKDLLRFGPGLSSRLHELRKHHKIVRTYEAPGLHRYTYKGPLDEN